MANTETLPAKHCQTRWYHWHYYLAQRTDEPKKLEHDYRFLVLFPSSAVDTQVACRTFFQTCTVYCFVWIYQWCPVCFVYLNKLTSKNLETRGIKSDSFLSACCITTVCDSFSLLFACCRSDSCVVIILRYICTPCLILSVRLASLGFIEPASVNKFTCKHLATCEQNGWWSTPYVLEAWQEKQTCSSVSRVNVCSNIQAVVWGENSTVHFFDWEIFLDWYACLSEVSFTIYWHLFSVPWTRQLVWP